MGFIASCQRQPRIKWLACRWRAIRAFAARAWFFVAFATFLSFGLLFAFHLDPNAGYDWRTYFYPQLHDPRAARVLNPLWVYLILQPLAGFSAESSYLLFCLISFGCVALTLRWMHSRRYAFLISAPLLELLFLGNLDVFPLMGLALGWRATAQRNPHLLGVAALLLLVKPNIGLPVLALYFLWLPDPRVLILPCLATVGSQIVYGWEWPVHWAITLVHGTQNVAMPMNISAFPLGLTALVIPALPLPRAERLRAVVAATFLSVPFVAQYSLITLLALPLPLWAYLPLSLDLWIGGLGFVNNPDRYFWAPQSALLAVLLWTAYRNRGSPSSSLLRRSTIAPPAL